MDQPGMPLLSVLMTVYNRELYLRDAIESVLNSSYKNFELIIVDDHSSDKSVEIAREYENKDPRIKVFVNERNLGDYPNRNKAASYAKGKYLEYLDSDDIIYPYGLEISVSRMEQFPSAGFGLAKFSFPDKPFPWLLSPHESYQMSFLTNRYLFSNAPSSAIIRRDVFEELGGFSGMNQLGDAEFWLKLAAKYPVMLFEAGQGWVRDHAESEKYKDSTEVKARMSLEVNLKALESADCPLTEEEKKLALTRLGKTFKLNRIKNRYSKYIIEPATRILKWI